MRVTAYQPEAPAAVHVDLGAIFVSLELSRSKWLITSLSPGRGEKMSKHMVVGSDVAAMLACFAELKRKAQARTGRNFPIIIIQEAGLRWLLDPSCFADRGYREPRRRSSVDSSLTPPPPGED